MFTVIWPLLKQEKNEIGSIIMFLIMFSAIPTILALCRYSKTENVSYLKTLPLTTFLSALRSCAFSAGLGYAALKLLEDGKNITGYIICDIICIVITVLWMHAYFNVSKIVQQEYYPRAEAAPASRNQLRRESVPAMEQAESLLVRPNPARINQSERGSAVDRSSSVVASIEQAERDEETFNLPE